MSTGNAPSGSSWGEITLGNGRRLSVCVPEGAHDALALKISAGMQTSMVAKLLCDLVTANGTLVDLGAHLGSACLPVAGLGARVVAVEASPRNAACLEATFEANVLHAEVVNVAVSDRPGKVSFWESGPYGRIASGADEPNCEVESMALPAILTLTNAKPTAIKLDIEGHEPAALKGMRSLLETSGSPPIVFESNGHALHHAGHRVNELTDILRDFGYTLYRVHDTQPMLIELEAGDVQSRTVVDILATKSAKLPWPSRGPLSADELAGELARELSHVNLLQRTWAAAQLAHARRDILQNPEIAAALDRCVEDPEAEVANAAQWWCARRVRLAASIGADQGGASGDLSQPSRRRAAFERIARPFLGEFDHRFAKMQRHLDHRLRLIEQRLQALQERGEASAEGPDAETR